MHLVHSAALRQVHDSQLAEEVSQAVFLLLPRTAGTFRRSAVAQTAPLKMASSYRLSSRRLAWLRHVD